MPGRSEERSPCPTPPELAIFVEAVEFPASKRDLLALAEERRAPVAVRQVLEALAQTDFESAAELRAAAESLSS